LTICSTYKNLWVYGYGYLSVGSDRGEEVAKDNNDPEGRFEEESKPNVKDKD